MKKIQTQMTVLLRQQTQKLMEQGSSINSSLSKLSKEPRLQKISEKVNQMNMIQRQKTLILISNSLTLICSGSKVVRVSTIQSSSI